jgi:hypothetical protein
MQEVPKQSDFFALLSGVLVAFHRQAVATREGQMIAFYVTAVGI